MTHLLRILGYLACLPLWALVFLVCLVAALFRVPRREERRREGC